MANFQGAVGPEHIEERADCGIRAQRSETFHGPVARGFLRVTRIKEESCEGAAGLNAAVA